jgi:hypothetical protein
MYDYRVMVTIGKTRSEGWEWVLWFFEYVVKRDCGVGLRYEKIRDWRVRERESM